MVTFPRTPQADEAPAQALARDVQIAFQDDVDDVAGARLAVRRAVARDHVEAVGAADHVLREQEARDEILVVARRSHRHGERHPAEADLERLLHRELIVCLDRRVVPDLRHRERHCGDAGGNLEDTIHVHSRALPTDG